MCIRDRGGVEDCDAVALDNLPEPIPPWPIRGALIHHDSRPVRERTIDDVTMSRHPADISGAPVHIVLFQIEHPLGCRVGTDQVSAGCVNDALRFAGGAGGVEDVKHVLRVHVLGLTAIAGFEHEAVVPCLLYTSPSPRDS